MKKKILLLILLIIFSVTGLLTFITYDRGFLSSILWRQKRPNFYSMEIIVTDYLEAMTKWHWKVVVEGNEAIKIELLSGPGHNSWFNKYSFTIEGVIEAGQDFCFDIRDCSSELDSTYYYPKVIVYGARSILIDNFRVCNSVDECLQEK